MPPADPGADGPIRLRRGVAVVPVPGGVVFVAGHLRKRVGGADAQRVLLPIVSAMDGVRTVAGIAAAAGVPLPATGAAVALLRRQGLALTSPPLDAGPLVEQDVVDYFELTAGASGRLAGPEEVVRALRSTAVAVLGRPVVADQIAADLLASGAGSVRVLGGPGELDEKLLDRLAGADRPVLVLEHDPGAGSPAPDVDGCLGRGIAVLRYFVTGAAVELGPLLHPGVPLCWRCFVDGHRAHFAGAEPPGPASPGALSLVAGLVVTELLSYVADLSYVQTFQAIRRLGLDPVATEQLLVAPETGCPRCSVGAALTGAPAFWEAYEDLTALPTVSVARPVSVGRTRTLVELETARADYPTSPRVRLPAAAAAAPGHLTSDWVTGAPAGSFDDALADIALRVAGQRPGAPGSTRRWTASSGNLGCIELYAVCRTAAFGAAPGTVFKYDDLAHQLVVTTAAPARYEDHLAGTGLAGTPPDALVVLVAATARHRHKYSELSVRLAHLDAGCALAQLAAVTAGHGLRLAVSDRWSAELHTGLELAEHDIVAAVAGVFAAEGDPDADHR